MGNRLPGTTADFYEMMTMLRRQGMSAKVILGGLGEATGYLGVQLKMGYSEAAEFAAKLQDATRTSERDMMALSDVIQRTFYLGVDADNMLQGFTPIGSGTTASGTALPSPLITRASGDRHRYSLADRETYSGVRAYWNNKPGANRKSVLVGESGNAKRLRDTYNSEAEAKEHANAEWNRIRRGAATMEFTLALGRADLFPEQKLRVRGFKPDIDDTAWLIAKATHTITGAGGFTTQLQLEIDAAKR